ncbi:hypothetical protein M885DRAFT_586366 [Pelagophyceae sp. CCMP2097]|nr:hypothetical protein M885DRAFT_586366 [Pelagophyceae sp. CCMP2097]
MASSDSDDFDADALDRELRADGAVVAAEKMAAEKTTKKKKKQPALALVSSSWASAPMERPEKRLRPEGDGGTSAAPRAAPPPPPRGDADAATTLYIGNLCAGVPEALLHQVVSEALGGDEAAVTSCRVVSKEGRCFAFVDFCDATKLRRALSKLDGSDFRGQQLSVTVAKPRQDPNQPKPRGGLDKELLASHVDKTNRDRVDAQVRECKIARAKFVSEEQPRLKAAAVAARKAGHFGHGFSADGRPKLHSGYKDMI